MDPFGRTIDYMRISVTDRCNERCLYRLPEGYKGRERKQEHLTAEESVRLVRVATGIGFRKFRLTGGEPLVRSDLVETVRAMKQLDGVRHMGLSTRQVLRTTPDDKALALMLRFALERKPREHFFSSSYQPCRPMTAIGG
jgi:cyclic pyranopterin phosphate synthase